MQAQDATLAGAVDELYGIDPAGFTQARNALAGAARQAGAAEVAKQITALRKPTRAAWILNRLVRSAPDLARDFAALGDELRRAHVSLDGAQIRELSKQRRQLIDQTAARAFATAGIDGPPAALRDDVVATLGAVLADAAVADRFAAGALVTAQDQSGFGPSGPTLTALPSPREPKGTAAAAEPAQPADAPPPARPNARAVQALAKAETELESAARAKRSADGAVSEAADEVRRLTYQLADANRRHDDALLDARHTQLQLTKATKRVDGLRR
jgi:hypothetical protein